MLAPQLTETKLKYKPFSFYPEDHFVLEAKFFSVLSFNTFLGSESARLTVFFVVGKDFSHAIRIGDERHGFALFFVFNFCPVLTAGNEKTELPVFVQEI